MRYTYYFSEEIENETVRELIDVISQFESVDLFVTTVGGNMWAMNALLHAINQHPDINIILTGYIASAGTFFLTRCKQPVYLHEDLDWILFHQADCPVNGQFRKTDIDRDTMYKQLLDVNIKLADEYKKLGLNSKEIKRFNNGEEVILYKHDFNRLKISKLIENNL